MSVDDLHGLDRTTSQLHAALQKARTLKSRHHVEPPLSSRDFQEDLRSMNQSDSDNDTTTAGSRSMVLEAAARSLLYERIAISAINDEDFVEVWNLLDIVQFCADQGLCEAGLTLWLIEELLDGQTIDGCRGVFDYLESRCERLVGTELTQNKRNTILRTCNELLHRLSRAEDAVFCGRVFIFLFKIFPLGDKSAVNLRGEYHTENVTKYGVAQDEAHADGEDSMRLDLEEKAETQSSDGQKKSVSFDQLYPMFWSLQNVFSNPPQLFQDGQLDSFKHNLEVTLAKFKAVPKVPTAPASYAQGRKRKRDANELDLASTFNPKYLTSKDLFKLEVSDVTFQRHILVQTLILIEFMLSLTAAAKKQSESLKLQRAMQYGYTLSEQDAAWATDMRKQIGDYLQRDGQGRLYHRMVSTILTRDKNWVRWKMESCQPIAKPAISPDDFNKARNDIKRAFGSRKMKAQVMGAIDLGFLAEDRSKDHMAKLRDHGQARTPNLQEAVEAFQGLQDDEEARAASSDAQRASKAWRALRLAAKTKLALFAEVQDATTGLTALLQQESAAPDAVKVEQAEENHPNGEGEADYNMAEEAKTENGDASAADEQKEDAPGDSAAVGVETEVT